MYVVWSLCVVLCQAVMCGVVFGVCVGGVCAHVYVFLCACFRPMCGVCSLLHLHLCRVCVWYMGGQVCARA